MEPVFCSALFVSFGEEQTSLPSMFYFCCFTLFTTMFVFYVSLAGQGYLIKIGCLINLLNKQRNKGQAINLWTVDI